MACRIEFSNSTNQRTQDGKNRGLEKCKEKEELNASFQSWGWILQG